MKIKVIADIHNNIEVFHNFLLNSYDPDEYLIQLGDFSFSLSSNKDIMSYIYFFNLLNNPIYQQRYPNIKIIRGNHEKEPWINELLLSQYWKQNRLFKCNKKLKKILSIDEDFIIPSSNQLMKWLNNLELKITISNYVFEHGDMIDEEIHNNLCKSSFVKPTTEFINLSSQSIHLLNEINKKENKILVIGHFVIPAIACNYGSFEPIIMSNLIMLDNGIGYDENYQTYNKNKIDFSKKNFNVLEIDTDNNNFNILKFDLFKKY